MAKNYVSTGCILDHVAGADISSGDIVVMNDIEGVAQTDALTGEVVAVAITGVYELTKTAGTAWAQGELLANTAGSLAPGAGPHIAAAVAESAATVGLVLLNGNSG